MKLRRTFLPLFAFFLLVLGALSFVEVAQASQDKLESLSGERTGTIFLEGEMLGDLILGARARLDFLYIDDVLVKASISSGKTPDWLKWHLGHFGSPETEGKELFVLRYEVYKPWDFDPFKITVNGVCLTKEDILTGFNRFVSGALPTGTVDSMAFTVPRSPDGLYNISYDEDHIEIDVKKIKRTK
ncbi:MAG: hypothetical protein H5T90_03035 [Acetomicrobium sp.]|nr:hypothetical protein [Acetomicrobium sp.]